MCLDFSEGTKISITEQGTAAPETQREMGPCVLYRSLATLLAAADPEQRSGFFVMGLEAILFQATVGRNCVIKSQGLLAWVTKTTRHLLTIKSHTKYK